MDLTIRAVGDPTMRSFRIAYEYQEDVKMMILSGNWGVFKIETGELIRINSDNVISFRLTD